MQNLPQYRDALPFRFFYSALRQLIYHDCEITIKEAGYLYSQTLPIYPNSNIYIINIRRMLLSNTPHMHGVEVAHTVCV